MMGLFVYDLGPIDEEKVIRHQTQRLIDADAMVIGVRREGEGDTQEETQTKRERVVFSWCRNLDF